MIFMKAPLNRLQALFMSIAFCTALCDIGLTVKPGNVTVDLDDLDRSKFDEDLSLQMGVRESQVNVTQDFFNNYSTFNFLVEHSIESTNGASVRSHLPYLRRHSHTTESS